MPYSLSLKSLIRLQRRQFSVGKKMRDLIGWIILLIYTWGLAILLYFMLKEQLTSVQPLYIALGLMGVLVPDFIFKLIFVRDQTVMDAFLMTRPILQKQWNRFLTLSQCWKLSNLIMPVFLLPVCLLFLPFLTGLAVWLALYVFSVLGGCLVMLMKRRGTYASEKAVSTATIRTVKPGRAGHALFGLQSRCLLRSRRMRTAMLYFTIFSLIEFVLYGMMKENRHYAFWLFFFISYAAIMLPQFGFGVEASYFGGIWTRPVPVKRLLLDKFKMSAILAGMTFLLAVPLCLLFKISIFLPVSYYLFVAGFCSPFLLIDAYKATPFDLFGKTFFNYQGSKGTLKLSSFVGVILIVAMGMALPELLPGWPCYLILSGLGLLGFIFHRPYFDWVERKFLKDKYKYMEKYQSQ